MHTYIFDFDHTMFNTNAMRAAFQMELLKHCGITAEQYKNAEAVATANGALYSLEAHISALSADIDTQERARAVAESIVQRMSEWVYPDVLPALDVLRAKKARLILLSFGNHDWQTLKIAHSGLMDFFDTIEIVEGSKTEPVHLFEAEEGGQISCINDRSSEINELFQAFPHVIYDWITREHTPYNQVPPTVPHRQISSFSEITATVPVD